MKTRFLHFLASLLVLLSAPVGVNVQTAVFKTSDDLKIVRRHTQAREMAPVLVSESKPIERTFVRSQKKAASFQDFSSCPSLKSSEFSFILPLFSVFSTQSSSRVLLLPKIIKNLIFLQTLF